MVEAAALLGTAAQLALGGALLIAGLAKVTSVRRLQDVLAALRFPAGVTRGGAHALVVAEAAVGSALLLSPQTWWPRASAALLAAGFAGAGLIALSTGEQITCACFGAGTHGILGRRQVAWLPIWLAAALVAQWFPPSWTASGGGGVLAAVLLAGCAVRAGVTVRLWLAALADRHAFQESARPLPVGSLEKGAPG